MGNTWIITSESMSQRIERGEALPLLPHGVPGPVQYSGQWWAVPINDTDYRPVADPEQIAMLDRNVERYTAARAATARARAFGGPS